MGSDGCKLYYYYELSISVVNLNKSIYDKKETMIDPTNLPDIFIIFCMSIHIIYYQIIFNPLNTGLFRTFSLFFESMSNFCLQKRVCLTFFKCFH